jgi:hypothetical protein
MDRGGGASRSTDPAAGTSQATDVSLREHLTTLIENSRRECQEGIRHVEESIEQARKNAEENTKKALDSIDRRFEGVNEFRAALNDLSQQMATRIDLKNLSDRTSERFDDVNRVLSQMNTRLDLREGEQAGSRLTVGSMVAVGTAIVAVLGFVVVLANYLSS